MNIKNEKKDLIIEKIKIYFKKIYKKENIIWKLSSFFIIAFIIIMPFFVIRDSMLKMENQSFKFMGNFVIGNIVSNTGVGLSIGNNNITLSYFLQSFSSLIPLAIFICSPNKYIDVGTIFMFFGGFSNLVDRSTFDNFIHLSNAPGIVPDNAVVDYWAFGFVNNSFIFNYADVFIVFGAILVCIISLILLIKSNSEDHENKIENKYEKNKI